MSSMFLTFSVFPMFSILNVINVLNTLNVLHGLSILDVVDVRNVLHVFIVLDMLDVLDVLVSLFTEVVHWHSTPSHSSVKLTYSFLFCSQAEYEVTPDEKRKVCGQELLEKYLNPKVLIIYAFSNSVNDLNHRATVRVLTCIKRGRKSVLGFILCGDETSL